MPDQYLVGNGRWCSTCYPGGRPIQIDVMRHLDGGSFGCNECAGLGRMPYTEAQIVASTVPGGIPVEEQERRADLQPIQQRRVLQCGRQARRPRA